MKALTFVKNFFQGPAWVFVVIGLLLFSARLPLPASWAINLPAAFTVLQTAGLMFTVYGLQMVASMIFWPDIKVKDLLREVCEENNTGAGIVLAGLLAFNGLATIGFAMWLVHALGSGVSAG